MAPLKPGKRAPAGEKKDKVQKNCDKSVVWRLRYRAFRHRYCYSFSFPVDAASCSMGPPKPVS